MKPAGNLSLKPKEKKTLAPELQKYHRLHAKMHAPRNAVENRMRTDGVDPKRFQEILEFMGLAPKPKDGAPHAGSLKEMKKKKKKGGLFGDSHLSKHIS